MAKKEVTLTARQWSTLYGAITRGAAANDVETQIVQHRLVAIMKEELKDLTDGQSKSILFTSRERRVADAMMANPVNPWVVDSLADVIWPIRKALGWVMPDYADEDDEE